MTGLGLAARYALFAAVATAANIAAQMGVFQLHAGPGAMAAALAIGTLAGLMVKYVLDKRWIFADRESGLKAHGRKFTLYTLMGVATTAIFWGTETAFALAFDHPAMKYVGAVLGLSVGYVTKYRLDRRFVFTTGARP